MPNKNKFNIVPIYEEKEFEQKKIGPYLCNNASSFIFKDSIVAKMGNKPEIFFENTEKDLFTEWFPGKKIEFYILTAKNNFFDLILRFKGHPFMEEDYFQFGKIYHFILNDSGQLLALILEECSGNRYLAGNFDNRKIGLLDENYNWKAKPEYDVIAKADNGCFYVWKGSKQGMINSDGKIIVNLEEDILTNFLTDNLIHVNHKGRDISIVDINGKEILKGEYCDVKMSMDGNYIILAVMSKEIPNAKMYGIAKKDGTIVKDCIYPKVIEDKDKFWLAGQFTELNKS